MGQRETYLTANVTELFGDMIRAVKYSVTTGFRLRWNIKRAIRKYSEELSRTSTSRLTEEVNKILASGKCCDIFLALEHYKLLVYMAEAVSVAILLMNILTPTIDRYIENKKFGEVIKAPKEVSK